MDEQNKTILDAFQTPKELQFLKTFLPFFPSSQQKMIAVFIKFLELQQMLQWIRRPQCFCKQQEMTPLHIMEAIKHTMPSEDAEQLDMILSMMSLMESGAMDTDSMMQSIMGGFSSGEGEENTSASPGSSENTAD